MHDPTLGPRPLAVYIATTLSNWEAHNRVADQFRAAGWEVTYDWTKHGSIAELDLGPEEREALALKVAEAEIDGVRDADVVVVLIPGGKGTHTELGAALALGIPVVMVGTDLPASGAYPSFYRMVSHVTPDADVVEAALAAMVRKATHARPLTFRQYAIARERTAVYPQVHPVVPVYAALGLFGEAGEIAEKLKKQLRDRAGAPFDVAQLSGLRKEIGDVLWYLDALAHDLGTDLETVARENVQKLVDRARRDALRGEGDDR